MKGVVELQRFGEKVLSAMCAQEFIQAHRAVIAESGRSDIGRLFYEGGIKKGNAEVAGFLALQMRKGRLRTADAAVAAQHLLALLQSETVMPSLLGVAGPLTRKEVREATRRAVQSSSAATAPLRDTREGWHACLPIACAGSRAEPGTGSARGEQHHARPSGSAALPSPRRLPPGPRCPCGGQRTGKNWGTGLHVLATPRGTGWSIRLHANRATVKPRPDYTKTGHCGRLVGSAGRPRFCAASYLRRPCPIVAKQRRPPAVRRDVQRVFRSAQVEGALQPRVYPRDRSNSARNSSANASANAKRLPG